jgi:signal transduction histidine kinase
MRLRTRYLLSLLVVVVIMAIPAIYGVTRTNEIRTIALNLGNDAAETSVAVGRLARQVAELDRHQRSYVATAEPALLEYVHGALDGLESHVDSLAGSYRRLLAIDLPVAELRESVDSLQRLVEAGALQEATGHLALVSRPLLDRADTTLLELARLIDRHTDERVAEAERLAATAVRATAMAVLLVLFAAALLAWLTASLLTRPLERVSSAMVHLAEGRFDGAPDPAVRRRDEVGDLFRSLHTMAARLEDLDRLKAHFTTMASHDLKTPISVIAGYAELLDESSGRLDADHRAVVRSLHQQARTLVRRVDQFIEISRLEARSLRLGVEEIHIRHFAAGLETALAPIAHRQGVDLVTSISPDAPTFIVADPDVLRSQVLGNLVSHAIKFSPPWCVVHVEFSSLGDRCLIEIRDQGPPVPPDQVDRLFDRYFRGSAASGRVGSDMGLPIAYEGVRAHGGTITVRSDGDGTRFAVELPLRPTSEPRPHREAPPRRRRPRRQPVD